MRKMRKTRVVTALAVAIVLRNFFPTVEAQTAKQPVLSEGERREAQEMSVTFTRRLSQTLDFGVVMEELFLPDAVERYLAEERKRAANSGSAYVTLSAGIFIDVGLLEKATAEDWRKLYIATNNFTLLGLVYASQQNVSFDDIKPSDLYPAEVIKLLDADPILRNLIEKKTDVRNFKSAEEMRRATAVLQQAGAIMRKGLPNDTDLEKTVIQMVMRDSSRTQPLDQKELEAARADMAAPKLEISDSQYFGFQKNTRMMWVGTFSMLELLVIRRDGKLRIVWAQALAE